MDDLQEQEQHVWGTQMPSHPADHRDIARMQQVHTTTCTHMVNGSVPPRPCCYASTDGPALLSDEGQAESTDSDNFLKRPTISFALSAQNTDIACNITRILTCQVLLVLTRYSCGFNAGCEAQVQSNRAVAILHGNSLRVQMCPNLPRG